MNIAEDIGDPFAIEAHTAFTARLIQTQIEPFSIEERKYIVKERIAIWKHHNTADWHDQHMRIEHLVLLRHLKDMRRKRLSGCRIGCLRGEPGNSNWLRNWCVASGRIGYKIYMKGYFDGLSIAAHGSHEE